MTQGAREGHRRAPSPGRPERPATLSRGGQRPAADLTGRSRQGFVGYTKRGEIELFVGRQERMEIQELLRQKREEILQVCAKHGARNVRVFGSVARNEADAESDLDLLVELEADRTLLDQTALIMELESLLGCPVDVVTEDGVCSLLRRRILKEAQPL